MKKSLNIRPYARLLTMLGEQLIKNEQIALAELIKNSYDADADWVKVSFNNFGNKFEIKPESTIVIEDNGTGMESDTIEKNWMNPATSNKKAKVGEDKRSPLKNRVIQGEKGIGRFAILKLGRKAIITTRPINSDQEFIINYDFSQYDDEFLEEKGKEKELYLDQIKIDVESTKQQEASDVIVNHKKFTRNQNKSGTRIEIYNLKGEWSKEKIETVNEECQKLESIFDKIFNKKPKNDFEIGFEINGERSTISDAVLERLKGYFEDSAVLKITDGLFDEKKGLFSYSLNNVPFELSLNDSRISGASVYKKHFGKNKDLLGNTIFRKSTCGSFKFNFFVFDFNAKKESKYYLSRKEKDFLKNHRIYLYRDRIRVSPYGDADNDWIETDKERAVSRTGDFLSNDQVVGFVEISKKGNPNLRDKTNREGLIEYGTSTKDFIKLLQSFLFFITQHPYKQYKIKELKKDEQELTNKKVVNSKFNELKEVIKDNKLAMPKFDEILKAYESEKKYYKMRLETTEDLSGVGLSVETASHDVMLLLSQGINYLNDVINDLENDNVSEMDILDSLKDINKSFANIELLMKDIQILFKSSKQKKHQILVKEYIEKVTRIYSRTMKRENISFEVLEQHNPLVVTCPDAVLLQLLINLFDNAIYWMSIANIPSRKIKIILNGKDGVVIFSDNGPGINEDDILYIFEAFYSGKEVGRGLGLYIAKQLLSRLGYSIGLITKNSEKVLEGANFVIDFNKEDKND
jgi:hypothetical protein